MNEFDEKNLCDSNHTWLDWRDKVCKVTQENLWENLDEKIFKKNTISYWLDEIFRLPEHIKKALKKEVKFDKEVSIQNLLKEDKIKDKWLDSLGTYPLISLAKESFDDEYFDDFMDYLDAKGERTTIRISADRLLELVRSFEKERNKNKQ